MQSNWFLTRRKWTLNLRRSM